MRRLEQKELVQRLDNNENSGKADIQELFSKLKREQVPIKLRQGERSMRTSAPHDSKICGFFKSIVSSWLIYFCLFDPSPSNF